PGLRVEGEARDAAGFLAAEVTDLADAEQVRAIRVDGDERRAGDLGGQLRSTKLAGRGVELNPVDAPAHFAGVGADEHPHGITAGRCGKRGHETEEEREEEESSHGVTRVGGEVSV